MDENDERWQALGDFIRAQRQLRDLSLRQLASLAKVSNPYLSQLERGMYRPSVDVLKNIAAGLRMSTETMLVQAGLLAEPGDVVALDVEGAVRLDPHLTTAQKEALLGVYRGFVGHPAPPPTRRPKAASKPRVNRTSSH
ncbi:MAG TPA: helix-turn-helix transcriptional regulator [Candidatus Dormibacteraeota bacterium]|nr:helix-turn-helix transcriptional regulator [Candidatus Dormibacteraeota bacterium]